MDMSPSNFAPTYNMPTKKSTSGSLAGTQDSSMAFSDHGDSSHVLKRSYSTPTVGGKPSTSSSDQQSSAMPAGEKKRNKLGYHRTSIACTHCRRRKIRCIASPDVQNRCMNCIRLKKECSFYPVDQQPPPDSKLTSQASGGSNAPTASSSPAAPNGSPVDLTSHQQPYPPLPIATVPSMATPTIQTPASEYFPPEAKVPSNDDTHGLSFSVGEQSSPWMTTDTNGNPISKTGDQSATWRSYPIEAAVSGQISPYPHGSTSSVPWAASNPDAGNAIAWSNMQPPVRSMSFSGELLGSHQASQFYPMPPQDRSYERHQPGHFTDMYGVHMGSIGPSTGQAIDPTGTVPSAVVPSQSTVAWQQQQQQQQLMSHHQQQQQIPYVKRGDYAAWGYNDGGSNTQM